MRSVAKWLGFALAACGVAVFPFAVWFPGPWGVMSLLLVMGGCVILVLVVARQPPDAEPEDRDPDKTS